MWLDWSQIHSLVALKTEKRKAEDFHAKGLIFCRPLSQNISATKLVWLVWQWGQTKATRIQFSYDKKIIIFSLKVSNIPEQVLIHLKVFHPFIRLLQFKFINNNGNVNVGFLELYLFCIYFFSRNHLIF